jgi:sulfur carrier protein ThiS
MIEVKVRLFGHLRARQPHLAPGEHIRVRLPEGSTTNDLFKALGLPQEEVKIVFVEGLICEPDRVLRDGEQVGIFPPIAGGASGPAASRPYAFPSASNKSPQARS